MERRVPAGLTPQEGRRFGLAVGTAFLVLGALLWWRGRPLAFAITGMIGALLVGGGVIIPGQLGPLYRLWMGLAKAISKVTTPILMATIFFLVFLPIGDGDADHGTSSPRARGDRGGVLGAPVEGATEHGASVLTSERSGLNKAMAQGEKGRGWD